MAKVTMRSNGDVQEVLVDGKRVMMDDGINVGELLYRMSHMLGFEYESLDGKWDRDGDFVASKRK